MNLSAEEHQVGRDNYDSAISAYDQLTRRGFLAQTIAGGAGVAAGIGAMYFGYNRPGQPVRVGVIGTGDEGNVLIGALNPDYVQVTAICDIRPSSIHRAFHGDWATASSIQARPGLMSVYGWKTEEQAQQQVKVYQDYQDLLADDNNDAVIIALPLHLHAQVAIHAVKAGKHVLCEKLMAHNVAQCKIMARMAEQQRLFLSVGHQRHYSILYDNAVNLIRWGLLGEIHHIRAQWHRNNLPGNDSWAQPIPGGEIVAGSQKRVDAIRDQLNRFRRQLAGADARSADLLDKQIAQWTQWDEDQWVDAEAYGYLTDSSVYGDGRVRTALEELVRWRLWDRTGGGLMAELGSHQLDAASIFVSALSKQIGHKVHPLTVHAIGGRHVFPRDRDADDHVYCMFEFPGQGYDYDFQVGYNDPINRVPNPQRGIPPFAEDSNKKIVLAYSSINGNGFGGYGEVVMGTKGTLVLEREMDALLFPMQSTAIKVGVKGDAGSAALDTSASGDPAPARAAQSAAGVPSRGYREEIEHWAWCISQGDWENQPRCNGRVALGDAIVALVAKMAIDNSKHPNGHGFIAFKPQWFDVENDDVPETDHITSNPPTIQSEKQSLGVI